MCYMCVYADSGMSARVDQVCAVFVCVCVCRQWYVCKGQPSVCYMCVYHLADIPLSAYCMQTVVCLPVLGIVDV